MPLPSLGTSLVRDERFVLVGLAVAVVAVVAGVVPVLRRFRDASEIKAIEPKTQYITYETEDALPLATLESLVGHYNYSIRETAAKIVFDRAVNDKTVLRTLLWGVAQPDYDERMKHLQMLSMVADQNNLYLFNTPMAYSAFVRSLEHCLGTVDGDALLDRFVDEYPLRDIAEKMCLMFLGNLACKFGVDGLVRARFVERWLAKQPWVSEDSVAAGMDFYVLSRDGNRRRYEAWVRRQQRVRNFSQYVSHRENRITELCLHLQKYPAGVAALGWAGLLEQSPGWRHQRHQRHHGSAGHRIERTNGLPAGQLPLPPASGIVQVNDTGASGDDTLPREELLEEEDEGEIDVEDDVEVNDDDNDDAAVTMLAEIGNVTHQAQQTMRPRPSSQNSQEEQRIRRQHREAMVLNDGTRPLRRDDIIERNSER